VATRNDHYLALAYAIRDRLMERWVHSARTYLEGQHRTVIYLSAEYLLGPQLARNLLALGHRGRLADRSRSADPPRAAGRGRRLRERFFAVKQANKRRLAAWLAEAHGATVDPSSLFDAQCKRIHEYKRQHLAILHAAWLYFRILRGQEEGVTQRTCLFAGKAAPGYRMAKLIIRLIHGVAQAIADEPRVRDRLRVVFVPDFNVKNAQRIYPAADLSEQISTARMEASGTGNMKFALNGARSPSARSTAPTSRSETRSAPRISSCSA
jgi:starch phosphorylase